MCSLTVKQHVTCHTEVFFWCADKKWGQAYLTREFFQILGETMPEQVLLVMAEDGGRPMAGALNMIGSHALFGRNWGCTHGREIKHLHFELCYYQVVHPILHCFFPCCMRSGKLFWFLEDLLRCGGRESLLPF